MHTASTSAKFLCQTFFVLARPDESGKTEKPLILFWRAGTVIARGMQISCCSVMWEERGLFTKADCGFGKMFCSASRSVRLVM